MWWYSDEFNKWNENGRPINENVIELYVSYSNIKTLGKLENLVNLKKLYCFNNHLTSLGGIENLVNLTYLYCKNNQLTSLEGMEILVKLLNNNKNIINNINYDFIDSDDFI
jgi:internalin A